MDTIGLSLAIAGTILMLPESFRLTQKNKEGLLIWTTKFPGAVITPWLFAIGVIFLLAGFVIQLVSTI
jgi:hypothetical protein